MPTTEKGINVNTLFVPPPLTPYALHNVFHMLWNMWKARGRFLMLVEPRPVQIRSFTVLQHRRRTHMHMTEDRQRDQLRTEHPNVACSDMRPVYVCTKIQVEKKCSIAVAIRILQLRINFMNWQHSIKSLYWIFFSFFFNINFFGGKVIFLKI